MIKTVLCVYLGVFLYFVSCLGSSHLKFIKKFLLFIVKTLWFQFSGEISDSFGIYFGTRCEI